MAEEEKKCPPKGAPSWMATFSDMMTLLMTFFVLLLSMANMDMIKVEAGFKSLRDAFSGKSTVFNTKYIGSKKNEFVVFPTPVIPTKNADSKSKQKNRKSADAQETKKPSKNISKKSTKQIQKQLGLGISVEQKKEVKKIEEEIKKQFLEDVNKGSMSFRVDNERVVIEYPEKGSFRSGRAELSEKMKRTTQKLSFLLKGKGVNIEVFGYTDNIPIRNNRFKSNWDLSAMRASAVANELVRFVKFIPEQIQVSGMADSYPKATNKTPQGRAQNRRVEIVITPKTEEDLNLNVESANNIENN
jgi:chemotaxis protein MotB